MLKRPITYTDFNGVTRTEDFYFNLSKMELMEMEIDMDGGIVNYLEKIVEDQDARAMFKEMKKLIKASYGVKSEDGKRFVKTDEVQNDFFHSAAFEALFMDLTQNENEIVTFMYGVVPADMLKAIQDQPQDKPRGLPPTPPKPPAL